MRMFLHLAAHHAEVLFCQGNIFGKPEWEQYCEGPDGTKQYQHIHSWSKKPDITSVTPIKFGILDCPLTLHKEAHELPIKVMEVDSKVETHRLIGKQQGCQAKLAGNPQGPPMSKNGATGGVPPSG